MTNALRAVGAAPIAIRIMHAAGRLAIALAMMTGALCASGPALAGTVTLPAGGTHSALQPLTVQWNGIAVSTGGPVNLELTVTSSSATVTVPLSQNVTNTGQHILPSSAYREVVCTTLPMVMGLASLNIYNYVPSLVPVSQMTFYLYVYNASNGADHAHSVAFKIKCPPKLDTIHAGSASIGSVIRPNTGHPNFGDATQATGTLNPAVAVPLNAEHGSLHIIKSVGYTGGGGFALVPASFAMTVNCTPWGPFNQAATVPTAPAGLTIANIPATSSCTVTEPLLPLINHPSVCDGTVAHWERGAPPPVTISANTTTNVTVTNWIACGRPAGWISVSKKIVNTTGAAIPATFNINVHCNETTGPYDASFPIQTNQSHAFGVDVGSSCTISEVPPPPISHVQGCNGGTASWTTSYAPAQTVTSVENMVTNVVVTNTLTCGKPAPSGHLTLHKTVINATGGPAPIPPSFSIAVHCTPSGPLSTVLAVPANGGLSVAAPIAAGSVCAATEQQLAAIPSVRGCKGGSASWTTVISSPVTIAAGATSTITVRNTLTCDKPAATGSLTLFKRVISEGSIPPPDINFYVDVNCLPGGPNETVKLNSANGFHDTLGGIVVGGSCTIAEQPPAVPPDLARRGCRWETSYPDGRRVPISAREGARLTVVNRWICKPGTETDTGTGTEGRRYDLSIKKTSANQNWSSGGAGLFQLVVTNNGSAIASPMSVVVNDNLPAGMTLVGAAGSGWTCGSSSPLVCTYSGAVAAGQTLPPISVTAIAGKVGGAVNCATVALSGAQDSVAGNDKDCIDIRIGKSRASNDNSVTPVGGASAGGPDIAVTNLVTSGTVPVDGTVAFELTVTNNGAPLDRYLKIELHDVLISSLMLQSATPASADWQCRTSGNELTCSFTGRIPSGRLPGIRVTARASRSGTFNNCASASLIGATDTMPANNTSCAMLRVGLDRNQSPTVPPTLIVPPRSQPNSDDRGKPNDEHDDGRRRP